MMSEAKSLDALLTELEEFPVAPPEKVIKLVAVIRRMREGLMIIAEDRLYTDHYGSKAKAAVDKQSRADITLRDVEAIVRGE